MTNDISYQHKYQTIQAKIAHMKRYSSAYMRGNKVPITGLSSHFFFSINNRNYLYCYINKNACSPMKRLIAFLSTGSREKRTPQQVLEILHQNNLIQSLSKIPDNTEIFFIYRDPIERIFSLYKDKFILRRGNTGIFISYQKLTQNSPETASFNDFVEDYLRPFLYRRNKKNGPVIDRHALSLHDCLSPIKYDHAIEMSQLLAFSKTSFGDEIAESFFTKPINATKSAHIYSEYSGNITAEKLHKRYSATSELPDISSLISLEQKQTLLKLYTHDYKIISHLKNEVLQ